MNLLQDTVRLLNRVSKETDLKANPSGHLLFALYNELLDAYTRLGTEQCRRFNAKESAYFKRKIAEANAYRKGRYDDKLPIKDAEREALEQIEHQFDEQTQAAELYMEYVELRDSVGRAIDYIRSLNSYIQKAESLPDPR